MSEQLIQNPEHVRNLWQKARPAADRADAARERAERLASIDAGVRDGSYRDDGPNLDACLDKLQADIDAMKLSEVGNKPDLAERERAAFDELNDAERWDGLS